MRAIKNVSIVVLSFDRISCLQCNLMSLLKALDGEGVEVIVVDNGSTDGSVEFLTELANEGAIHLVQNKKNRGIAEGRNRGFRRATRDFILALDQDIGIDKAAILALLEVLQASEGAALASPKIVDVSTGRLMNGYAEDDSEIVGFYEACFLFRRAILETVGYLDPDCFWAGEGLDYGLRLVDNGFTVRAVSSAVVQHFDSRPLAASSLKRLRWARAFTRIYAKHLPPGTALLFAWRTLVGHAWAGVASHRFQFLLRLPIEAAHGWVEGRKVKQKSVQRRTLVRISNPALRQDFGNKSIALKLLYRVRRIW